MASEGENWIKECLETQGYNFSKVSNEDIFAYKDKIGIVIEEKDWKDPVKVNMNKIYQLQINGYWRRHDKGQVVGYAFNIKKDDMEKKKYRFIICVYVFSNLQGRLVQPIYFRKFGTVFCVHRNYFAVWLKSIERTYLGEPTMDIGNGYMGGK